MYREAELNLGGGAFLFSSVVIKHFPFLQNTPAMFNEQQMRLYIASICATLIP